MTYSICPNCKNKLKCGQFTKGTENHTNGDKTNKYNYVYECDKCESKMTIIKELYLTNKDKTNKDKTNKKKSKDKKNSKSII